MKLMYFGSSDCIHGFKPPLQKLMKLGYKSSEEITINYCKVVETSNLVIETLRRTTASTVILFSVFWELVEQEIDEHGNAGKGLMRVKCNVDLVKLCSKIEHAQKTIEFEYPELEIVWVLPPAYYFLSFNLHHASEKNDPLSRREQKISLLSSDTYNSYIQILNGLLTMKNVISVVSAQLCINSARKSDSKLKNIPERDEKGLLNPVYRKICQDEILSVIKSFKKDITPQVQTNEPEEVTCIDLDDEPNEVVESDCLNTIQSKFEQELAHAMLLNIIDKEEESVEEKAVDTNLAELMEVGEGIDEMSDVNLNKQQMESIHNEEIQVNAATVVQNNEKTKEHIPNITEINQTVSEENDKVSVANNCEEIPLEKEVGSESIVALAGNSNSLAVEETINSNDSSPSSKSTFSIEVKSSTDNKSKIDDTDKGNFDSSEGEKSSDTSSKSELVISSETITISNHCRAKKDVTSSQETSERENVNVTSDMVTENKEDQEIVKDKQRLTAEENKELVNTEKSLFEEEGSKSPTELNKKEIKELDNEETSELDYEEVTEMDNENVTEMDKEKVRELDNEEVTKVDNEEVTELDNQEITELDNEEITELENQEITELDNEEITEVDNEEITELDNDEITELDNEDITELDNEDITELDNEEITELDNQDITELDNEEITELDNEEATELDTTEKNRLQVTDEEHPKCSNGNVKKDKSQNSELTKQNTDENRVTSTQSNWSDEIVEDELIYEDIDEYEAFCSEEGLTPRDEMATETTAQEIQLNSDAENSQDSYDCANFYEKLSCLQSEMEKESVSLFGLSYLLEIREDGSGSRFMCVLCHKKLVSSVMVMPHFKSVAHKAFYVKEHHPDIWKHFGRTEVKNWSGSVLGHFNKKTSEISLSHKARVAVCDSSDVTKAVSFITRNRKSLNSDGSFLQRLQKRESVLKKHTSIEFDDIECIDLESDAPRLGSNHRKRLRSVSPTLNQNEQNNKRGKKEGSGSQEVSQSNVKSASIIQSSYVVCLSDSDSENEDHDNSTVTMLKDLQDIDVLSPVENFLESMVIAATRAQKNNEPIMESLKNANCVVAVKLISDKLSSLKVIELKAKELIESASKEFNTWLEEIVRDVFHCLDVFKLASVCTQSPRATLLSALRNSIKSSGFRVKDNNKFENFVVDVIEAYIEGKEKVDHSSSFLAKEVAATFGKDDKNSSMTEEKPTKKTSAAKLSSTEVDKKDSNGSDKSVHSRIQKPALLPNIQRSGERPRKIITLEKSNVKTKANVVDDFDCRLIIDRGYDRLKKRNNNPKRRRNIQATPIQNLGHYNNSMASMRSQQESYGNQNMPQYNQPPGYQQQNNYMANFNVPYSANTFPAANQIPQQMAGCSYPNNSNPVPNVNFIRSYLDSLRKS